MENQYIPGACNIGKSEIERRHQAGWAGLIISVILYGLLIYFDLPRVFRLVIFFPAMMAATGFLQARAHFCAYFGMRGVYNFSPEVGNIETVGLAEFRAKDRRRAWHIIIYSAIISAVAAVAAYYIPL